MCISSPSSAGGDQERSGSGRLSFGVGDRQCPEVVRPGPRPGEHALSVENVVVAVQIRLNLQLVHVQLCTRLNQKVPESGLTPGYDRQIPVLLLLRAPLLESRPE